MRHAHRTSWTAMVIAALAIIHSECARGEVTSDQAAAIINYPYITVDSLHGIDTIVQLSNAAIDDGTTVHCFYEDATVTAGVPAWHVTDFYLRLTTRQPLGWRASQGRLTLPCDATNCIEANQGGIPAVNQDPFTGSLLCFTVDGIPGNPIDRNALKGEATIEHYDAALSELDVAKYNAIGIQAIPGANNGDDSLILGGPGAEYNGCPAVNILNHVFDGALEPTGGTSNVYTKLVIVPCSQDPLVQQTPGSSVVQYLVFNEFEQRFSTSRRVDGQLVTHLSNLDTSSPSRSIFSVAVQGTLTGQTRMRSIDSGVLAVAIEEHVESSGRTMSAAVNTHQQGERDNPDVIGRQRPCGNGGVTCTALDQCHVAGTCDFASGSCSNPAAPDGTQCSAGGACYLPDACLAGACIAAQCVSGTVGSTGGTVSTGQTASPTTPLQTAVTTPTGGTVSITQDVTGSAPPPGFGVVGEEVMITAPAASPGNPLVLVFVIDASQIPAGADQNTIQIFKDGVLVPACLGPAGVASPDPCISDRTLLGDGDVRITVLTSSASLWTFAVPTVAACGNGVLDVGEQCDDGNVVSGDRCPADCSYNASGALIRGDRAKPARDRAGCQLEWYVVNPSNPPDRFGLPRLDQLCEDGDPSCDFDPRPGRCRFEVVLCVNNADPNLPACTPAGVPFAEVIARRQRMARVPSVAALTAANNARLTAALGALLDPQDPASGYTNALPLTATQQGFCTAPIPIDVFSGASAGDSRRARAWLEVKSGSRRSRLRLTCQPRRLP